MTNLGLQVGFASGLCGGGGAAVGHNTCRLATCGATHASLPNAVATSNGRRTAGTSYGFTCSTNYGVSDAVRTFSATCTGDVTGSYADATGRCVQVRARVHPSSSLPCIGRLTTMQCAFDWY